MRSVLRTPAAQRGNATAATLHPAMLCRSQNIQHQAAKTAHRSSSPIPGLLAAKHKPTNASNCLSHRSRRTHAQAVVKAHAALRHGAAQRRHACTGRTAEGSSGNFSAGCGRCTPHPGLAVWWQQQAAVLSITLTTLSGAAVGRPPSSVSSTSIHHQLCAPDTSSAMVMASGSSSCTSSLASMR